MRSESTTGLSPGAGDLSSIHCPGCAAERAFGEPSRDTESWSRLHDRHHQISSEAARLRIALAEANVGLASFENLFRISPVPLIEQDYTRVEAWMDQMRREGVTDIREHLGGDVEKIRSLVPLIWIVAANPAAVRAVGLPLDELLGPIDPRIVNDEALPSWLSQLEAVWDRKPEAHAAFVASTADGRRYDAESTLSAPVIDGEPDFSRAVFTLVDVTEHRSEERRMGDLIAAKNEFLASVSHEIRTPLTAIVGFGQILEADHRIHRDSRDMVMAIVQQSQEVSDLVEDLLVAVRAEAGQVNVEIARLDVDEQVSRVMSAGGSFTTGVRLDTTGEGVEAMGDAARLRQIIRNLLTNAERYGGSDVAVAIERVDDHVHLMVSDDGPGLPEDEWEPIFELYHRADDRKSSADSLGIGLSVSRQLAELMGGSLHYSREASRSVFHLSLPAPNPL